MKIKAYAKVNLSLDVTGKRVDGYHTLSSVFQSVSLSDIVEIKKADSISVKCSDTSLNGEDNLCNTAAVKFFEAAKIQGGAEIFVEKYIPLAGGLGGGSTDAGAVLKGLNELYGKPLSEQKLLEIALSLGADVPFCMVGGTKLCEGIGEIMTELPSLPECYIVIAKKGQKSSTGDMYKALDGLSDRKKSDVEKIKAGLKKQSLTEVFSGAYNCFELVCEQTALKEAREIAISSNAVYCGLSGAGPSVIAVYDNPNRALKGLDAFRTCGFQSFLVEPTAVGCEKTEY